MATTLKSNGITFTDNTTLTSIYNFVPKGKKTVFYQASAPTGWSQVTTISSTSINNRAIRMFSGTGQSLLGGNLDFTNVFKSHPLSSTLNFTGSFQAGNTTLSIPQMTAHTHPANGNGGNAPANSSIAPITALKPGNHSTNDAGGSGGHTHPITYGTATGPFSANLDVRVKYVDCIICSID